MSAVGGAGLRLGALGPLERWGQAWLDGSGRGGPGAVLREGVWVRLHSPRAPRS